MQRSASVAEIGPGVYRVATYHERLRSSVNQFVIAGDEPALISTGLRESFAQTWDGIAEILDPALDGARLSRLGYPADGPPRAYVCVGDRCLEPVSDPGLLADRLAEAAAGRSGP